MEWFVYTLPEVALPVKVGGWVGGWVDFGFVVVLLLLFMRIVMEMV